MLGLPFYSLARYRGMGQAVKALRALGISEAMKARSEIFSDLGDVPLSDIEKDSGRSNLRNFPHFLRDTDRVLHATSAVNAADFVFCLGGECTFVPGSLAGFKSKFKGEPGMLWMDAHGDFNTPETTTSGFIGGMPLAFACGLGPELSPAMENTRPLLKGENVVHVGSRVLDPLESKAMQSSKLKLYSAVDVHKMGISKVAREAAEHLAERSDWIVCHLDVDAIDPEVISAVNYHESGGLTLDEVKTVVHELEKTGKLKVFNLTAYNPNLDVNNDSAQKLLKLTSEIFALPK